MTELYETNELLMQETLLLGILSLKRETCDQVRNTNIQVQIFREGLKFGL